MVKELQEESHAYLRVLTRKPEKGDVNRFLELYRDLSGKAEREYAESILEVFMEANEKWIEKWKGEGGMVQRRQLTRGIDNGCAGLRKNAAAERSYM